MNVDRCHRIHQQILATELSRSTRYLPIKVFRRFSSVITQIPRLSGVWNKTVMQALYSFPGPDLPPAITHDAQRGWTLKN